MKISAILLCTSLSFGIEAMKMISTRDDKMNEARKVFAEGIFEIRRALSNGSLTKSLVEEKICKAPLEDSSMLINFAKEIRRTAFISADAVIRKGTNASYKELENALAAVGILQWAGLEALDGSSVAIRLSVLLRLCSEQSKKKELRHETSV